MNGFFRVNNNLQSTNFPNIFAGGDCVTMESYVDKPYPTKAGVYAVRAGPIIAENIVKYIEEKPLIEYVPQTAFLSLMMTADGNCIGSRFGMGFVGKWVWGLKDFIDMGFMNLFDPRLLFNDYKNKGTEEPIENFALFDDESQKMKEVIDEHKKRAFEVNA
jgi:NADH dehydrogenase FAD-containing subunit